jgi:hypothetical protein
LGFALPFVGRLAIGAADRQTGDCHRLVSAGKVTFTLYASDYGKKWMTIVVGRSEPKVMLTSDQARSRMVRIVASNDFRSSAPVVVRLSASTCGPRP